MIIKFSLVRLIIIFLLVLLFPLIQNQWLNLYLFDKNNFSIYKLLYFFSGIIAPTLLTFNSISKFTNYKFKNNILKYERKITGTELLLISSIVLVTLSLIIYNYIFINLKIIYKLFIIDYNYHLNLDIDKQILFIAIISILLIFKKIKLFLKKLILINYFIISTLIWYSHLNNINLYDLFLKNNIFKFDNINFINLVILLSIEILYYLWSYISYDSFLSDWSVPKLRIREMTPLLKILIFYLLILLYYSLIIN